MIRARGFFWFHFILCGLVAAAVGCQELPAGRNVLARRTSSTATSTAEPQETAATKAAQTASIPPHELAEVFVEYRKLVEVDPSARERVASDLKRLSEDLQRTDPAHWPYLKQHLLTSIAYRRGQAERKSAGGAEDLNAGESKAHLTAAKSRVASTANHADAGSENAVSSAAPSNKQSSAVNVVAAQVSDDKWPTSPTRPNRIGSPQNPKTLPAKVAAISIARSPDERVVQATYRAPAESAKMASQTLSEDAAESGPAHVTNWRSHLATAIKELENQTRAAPSSPEAIRQQAALRFLYLADGRRDEAVRPIPGIDRTQQDFWSKQLYGLRVLLDTKGIPNDTRRATEALVHLRDANRHLGELGELIVRNLEFCQAVNSFGVFTRFPSRNFKPQQEVLLYAEMENYASRESKSTHFMSFTGSYQIFAEDGRSIHKKDLPKYEETANQPRRDFFMHYRIWMPERIAPGRYTLQLTVEDNVSMRIGQSSIEFHIK